MKRQSNKLRVERQGLTVGNGSNRGPIASRTIRSNAHEMRPVIYNTPISTPDNECVFYCARLVLPGLLFTNQADIENERLGPVSSWHAFHIMPAILINVRNKWRFTITQNLQSTNIYWQNCTNSTAVRNIVYFIHTSLVYKMPCYWNRQMSLGLLNVNIAHDWLSRETLTLHHYSSSRPQFSPG